MFQQIVMASIDRCTNNELAGGMWVLLDVKEETSAIELQLSTTSTDNVWLLNMQAIHLHLHLHLQQSSAHEREVSLSPYAYG
jgi:hypothetical protein